MKQSGTRVERATKAQKDLPLTVRIGPMDVPLNACDDGLLEERLLGCWNRDTREIRLRSGIGSPQMVVEVLIHELLHALWTDSGLPDTNIEEEDAVTKLAPRLQALLRDNPELVKWITKWSATH